MTTTPRRFPPPGFTPPQTGSLEQRVRLIGEAISRKADVNLEPSYSAVILAAPDGTHWRVSVTPLGVLETQKVVP